MADSFAHRTLRDALQERGTLRGDTVAARVDGAVRDLHAPLAEGAVAIEPVAATHPDALPLIRHSTAHIMSDAVQRLFPGTKVAFGPATDAGFFYDYDRRDGHFSDDDLRLIEAEMAEIIAQDLPFRRSTVTVEEARALLEGMGETYKVDHLGRLAEAGVPITLYRHGDWVDLCEGPHVPSTRFLEAFKLTTVAGAYFRGDERNPMLQRIYGTAFPSRKALRSHLKQLEEAKKRDHRKLGRELDLIGFHPLAPASPFFLPRGARVYNLLVDYVRGLYDRHGYDEVITPQILDNEIFRISGHLPSYAENMFLGATVEDLEKVAARIAAEGVSSPKELQAMLLGSIRYGVKPMNCPGHCLMFGAKRRSYRELPMRLADFGRLHRFERSGVVQGLTRVRTFAQDDAHIFCAMEQVQEEIVQFLGLVYQVYEDFGFSDVEIVIATRPDERLGGDDLWDRAERALLEGVRARGLPCVIVQGEGAFYGPKVELHLKDALGRPWQLGTIQVDFNLPERFGLGYVGQDNATHRPVMLHRAILGSVERFFGVLVEHLGGAFPTWLAPEQIRLLTVSEKFNEHARRVRSRLELHGLRVGADLSSDKLGAKVRAGRLMRVPYLGVIGEREVQGDGLGLRSRDENADLGFVALAGVVERLCAENAPPSQRAAQRVLLDHEGGPLATGG